VRFFEKRFGNEARPAEPDWDDEDDDIMQLESTADQPIDGPPEFVRAVELQRAYWTYDADEQSRLESRGLERLDWPELLRLHHLTCVQRLKERLNGGPHLAAATAKSRAIVRRLAAVDSPYRPRPALVWQRGSTEDGPDREPDLEGEFFNASITHLGCWEIYRVDPAGEPTGIDFVSFDDVDGIAFTPSEPIRPALLYLSDGSTLRVLVPELYGLTWVIGNELERARRLTRFVGNLPTDAVPQVATGMGVGQQDLAIRDREDAVRLVGIASVVSVMLGLDITDPRFDEKARARGMDPEEIRRHRQSNS
jgi:hypothetical protein